TMQELEAAFSLLPDLDTGALMIGILASNGFTELAIQKIHDIKQFLPSNPILRKQWLTKLTELEEDLSHTADAAQQQAH
ncbi:MAG: hypothetical protein ACU836_18715, partial [Gammaproteobacteria bacterium]